MKHHVSFYIKLYSLCASCSFLYCNGCTMFLFMLQFMHHIFFIAIDALCSFLYCNGWIMFLFYNAMDAPCSFLYCNGGTIFLFIMQTCTMILSILQWMQHVPFYIKMDAPCSFFISQWMHHVPFYIKMDAPCSFFILQWNVFIALSSFFYCNGCTMFLFLWS